MRPTVIGVHGFRECAQLGTFTATLPKGEADALWGRIRVLLDGVAGQAGEDFAVQGGDGLGLRWADSVPVIETEENRVGNAF